MIFHALLLSTFFVYSVQAFQGTARVMLGFQQDLFNGPRLQANDSKLWYYNPRNASDPDNGVCQLAIVNTFVASLNFEDFGELKPTSKQCYQCIRVQNGEKSIYVRIMEVCEACKKGDIELSPFAFDKLYSNVSLGVSENVTWDSVESSNCPDVLMTRPLPRPMSSAVSSPPATNSSILPISTPTLSVNSSTVPVTTTISSASNSPSVTPPVNSTTLPLVIPIVNNTSTAISTYSISSTESTVSTTFDTLKATDLPSIKNVTTKPDPRIRDWLSGSNMKLSPSFCLCSFVVSFLFALFN